MVLTIPETFKIMVTGASQSKARTDLKARRHTVIVDEPTERGGTDLAPSPLETMLSSFLACTNVVANIIAEDMGIEIDHIALALVGHFDTRGLYDKAPVSIPFPTIELQVDVTTSASAAEIDQLKAALALRCPISVILREAGSEIVETWRVVRPRDGA